LPKKLRVELRTSSISADIEWVLRTLQIIGLTKVITGEKFAMSLFLGAMKTKIHIRIETYFGGLDDY
jgi:hypothetical protein